MTTENEERVRIRTIVGSDGAKQLPQLAETLAFATDLGPAEAEAVLAAAAMDLAATTAVAEAVPVVSAPLYSGGLGMPEVLGGDKPSAAAGWKRAIKQGDRGPQYVGAPAASAPDHGWSKAKSYRKIA